MLIKIYPKGFDPRIASGLPSLDDIREGRCWTQIDVDAMRDVERLASVVEVKSRTDFPVGKICRELTDEEATARTVRQEHLAGREVGTFQFIVPIPATATTCPLCLTPRGGAVPIRNCVRCGHLAAVGCCLRNLDSLCARCEVDGSFTDSDVQAY